MLHAADLRDKAVADCYTAYVVSEIEVLNLFHALEFSSRIAPHASTP